MKLNESGATTQERQIEFTRVTNDINGNPRYVFHFLNLLNEGDNIKTRANRSNPFDLGYDLAINKAHEIGGRKFHNKQYGGGIIIQSYSIQDEEKVIESVRKVNTNFLKEWRPAQHKQVDKAIYNFFSVYKFKYTTDHTTWKELNPFNFESIDELFGLAYTSSGDYAGLWICNGIEILANETHRFIGFAINDKNHVVAICQDNEENELFIEL